MDGVHSKNSYLHNDLKCDYFIVMLHNYNVGQRYEQSQMFRTALYLKLVI